MWANFEDIIITLSNLLVQGKKIIKQKISQHKIYILILCAFYCDSVVSRTLSDFQKVEKC